MEFFNVSERLASSRTGSYFSGIKVMNFVTPDNFLAKSRNRRLFRILKISDSDGIRADSHTRTRSTQRQDRR